MIYIFDQFDKIDERIYFKLFNLLPPSRKALASKRKGVNKKITIVEYFLLKSLLKFNSFPDFSYTKNGKPFLDGFHFSISHSGSVLVVAVGARELGVDIEKITFKPNVAKYCFSPRELKRLNKSHDKPLFFTKIFTKKEAFIKLKARTLSSIKDLDYKGAKFKHYKYKDYVICLAKEK